MAKQEERKSFPHQKYEWADIEPSDVVKIEYPTGHTAQFFKAGDMHFPILMKEKAFAPDQRLNVERVKRMKVREDDIFICAHPRSGTHWIWEIAHMLMKGDAEYSKIGTEFAMIEFHLPDEFDNWSSPRVFCSHYEFHNLPYEIAEKKCKIIYVQRNPKDVAVSSYCFMNGIHGEHLTGSWKDFFYMFLNDVHTYMNWFKSTISWEKALQNKDLNILPVYYEDLKQDPETEIARMAKFLNVSCNKDKITEIADKCSFRKLRESQKALKEELMVEFAKVTQPDVNVKDAVEIATSLIYRKGDVGDWKNWFTVAQEEQFDAIYAERMKDSKLRFKYVL